jgi:hypothetical protein
VITRLHFGSGDDGEAIARTALDAPDGARPIRIVIGSALDPRSAPFVGVVEEVFVDEAHHDRFEAWAAPVTGPALVAETVVVRGADWWDRQWVEGGPTFVHMALATRARGLTRAEFSARWRDHAGSARTAAGATTAIPDEARGLAYVQHHPIPGGDVAYDAVNAAYFDDLEGLQRRIDWFRANGIGQVPDDLFGATSFLAVRAELLT